MKGREGKGPPAADLLVCFPSRAHLSLMPKPICSPARPSEHSKLHHHRRHHRHPPHHHHLRKSINRGGGATGHGSPLLWAKTKSNYSTDISEPTSPKVTCAGQIKVRTKPSSCKNWQSVMEEIERLHNNRKHKKRHSWIEALGFKKDVMQFLTCLRNIRFDFRCFGSIPTAEITSDEEEGDEDDDEDVHNNQENSRITKDDLGDSQASRAVFSKWFMILQENNLSKEFIAAEDHSSKGKVIRPYCHKELVDDGDASCAPPPPPPPPPNALLLMRCRSAPAKSWLEEKEEEKEERYKSEDDERKVKENGKKKKEEEAKETDFSEFSCEIAKETRVMGGIQDKISRSRSWKR